MRGARPGPEGMASSSATPLRPCRDNRQSGIKVTLVEPGGFGSAILKVIDAEKTPLRVLYGEQPVQIAAHISEQYLAERAPVSR